MKIYLNIIILIFNLNFIKLQEFEQEALKYTKRTHELDPIWYLNKFGYLKQNSNMTSTSSKMSQKLIMLNKNDEPNSNLITNNDDEFRNAIKKFQKFANLNVSGILDELTLKTMKLPRCGHPDFIDTSNDNKEGSLLQKIFRKKRYALQGSKWLKHNIRYKISKYPILQSLTKDQIDREVSRAFELWGTVSQLKFQQIRDNTNRFAMFFGGNDQQYNEPVDIEIKFETGYHGDSEPFDGPGYILGHAYFPQFGGSTHFDAEELWTTRSPEGVNLYQVAVHEFGHALGLEHSDNYDAIMAPFFRGYTENFVLNPDDITAIQYLYGKNPNQANANGNRNWKKLEPTNTNKNKIPIVTPSTPSYSDTIPLAENLCTDGRFDAITLLQDGFTYVFKGAYVYKFDANFNLDSSFPKLIRSLFGRWDGLTWISVPDNIDTILFVPDTGKTYFFKNDLYWRTTHYELDSGYPKLISDNFKGLNYANGFYGKLDASFLWSGNGRVYFIAGDKYWRYDLKKMEVEYGYPKSLSLWRGLPMRITGALLWTNGATYFFSDEFYYRFNDLAFKVEEAMPPYPRAVVDAWFGCTRLGNLILNENNDTLSRKLGKQSSLDNEERVEEYVLNDNTVLNLQSDGDELDEGVLNREKLIDNLNTNTKSNNKIIDEILKQKTKNLITNNSSCSLINFNLFILIFIFFIYLY